MTIVTNQLFATQLEELKNVLQNNSTIVIDVETNGLDSFGVNQICGVGVGEPLQKGLIQYYPFRHQYRRGENLSTSQLNALIQILNDYAQSFIGYNLKFDMHFLEKEGLSVVNKKLIDVIVMVRLIEHSDIRDLGLTPTGRRNYGDSVVQYDLDMKKELHGKN